jgi:uncharacterized protein YgiM (DUF1202 family)
MFHPWRKINLSIISLLILIGLVALPVSAGEGNPAFSLDCSGFSSAGGQLILDRDNTGADREVFVLSAVDGAGNVIYSPRADAFFVGGTVTWGNGDRYGWTSAPQANPLTLQVISLSGNGLPLEVVYQSNGSCENLPDPVSAEILAIDGIGGGDLSAYSIFDTLVLLSGDDFTFTEANAFSLPVDGSTSPSAEINTAPPRPEAALTVEDLPSSLSGYAVVATDNLNLRSGNGVQFTRVGILDGGTPVIVLGRDRFAEDNETWWYVQAGELRGWVNGSLLVYRGDLTDVPVVPVRGELDTARAIFGFDSIILYNLPTEFSRTLCTIPGGQEYAIIGTTEREQWYQLEATCNGVSVVGWVPESQVTVRNPGVLIPIVDIE